MGITKLIQKVNSMTSRQQNFKTYSFKMKFDLMRLILVQLLQVYMQLEVSYIYYIYTEK